MPFSDYPAGIILAGGLSKRMGSCKQLMPLCGKPLIQYTIETLLTAGLTHLVITVNPVIYEAVQSIFKTVISNNTARYSACYCDFAVNTEPERGQGTSAALAVKTALLKEPTGFLFCTADQPFLSAESVSQLCALFRNNNANIVSAAFRTLRCSPTVFPRCLSSDLLQLNGTSGGRSVISTHKELLMLFQLSKKIEMFDIDTPEDFLYAERYMQTLKAGCRLS